MTRINITDTIVLKEYDDIWGTSIYYFKSIEEAKDHRNEINKERDKADKVGIRITIYDTKNNKVY